jgi:hypothetical protein
MFGDGRLVHLPGGVDEYLARVATPPGPSTGQGRPAPTGGAQPAEQDGGPSAGEVRAARKEMSRLERLIGKLEQREVALHDQLAAHATDYLKITELDGQLRAVRTERERTAAAWLVLAEQVPDS